MSRVVVTGGAGKAGRAVVRDLLEHGYDVVSVDLVRDPTLTERQQLVADLTDYGEAVDALKGADAVVHLAAIPAPGLKPDELTFRVNTTSTYNVFAAAQLLGLRRVVWASSETTLGLPFERELPRYAPIDEEHPLLRNRATRSRRSSPRRWRGSSAAGTGSRTSAFASRTSWSRTTTSAFPGSGRTRQLRRWNLWGYVDARDVAQSCRLALDADLSGAEAFIVAAADTVMNRPSADLMAEAYPDVELRGGVGEFGTLLSIEKARRLLGYEPAFSWRDAIGRST